MDYKPRYDELYYTIASYRWSITPLTWTASPGDFMRKALGIVFKTEEEAIQARPQIYKQLTGREWEE